MNAIINEDEFCYEIRWLLTIFVKCSIADVWQAYKNTTLPWNINILTVMLSRKFDCIFQKIYSNVYF